MRSTVSRGFTLLEMVIVMAIIGILAGGIITFMGDFDEGPKLQKAETEIQGLDAALIQYKTNAGRYPTQEQGLQALVAKPTTSPIPKKHAKLLTKIPKDPWGNDYIYKMPGSKNPRKYEIISYGPDGKEGGGDDISSQDE